MVYDIEQDLRIGENEVLLLFHISVPDDVEDDARLFQFALNQHALILGGMTRVVQQHWGPDVGVRRVEIEEGSVTLKVVVGVFLGAYGLIAAYPDFRSGVRLLLEDGSNLLRHIFGPFRSNRLKIRSKLRLPKLPTTEGIRFVTDPQYGAYLRRRESLLQKILELGQHRAIRLYIALSLIIAAGLLTWELLR